MTLFFSGLFLGAAVGLFIFSLLNVTRKESHDFPVNSVSEVCPVCKTPLVITTKYGESPDIFFPHKEA